MKEYELMVLGTGPAAATIAFKCRKAGMTVGVVDPRPYGGTCALRGCNPKKVLVRAAELIDWIQRAQGIGIRVDKARIDWPEIMAFKRTFTEPVPDSRDRRFRNAGIEQFHGMPRFISTSRIDIDGTEIECRKIAVATGAVPRRLNIPGEDFLITNEAFLELEELPKRIFFVGGGYITFEFAHVAARAGADVVICEHNKRPLEMFEPELVDSLVASSREQGINILTSTTVKSIERRSEGGFKVNILFDEVTRSIDVDLVVHGAGRVPNTEPLNLEAANVDYGPKGIEVDRHLRSVSNPNAYAAGDVAANGVPMLSPVAIEDGRTVGHNITSDQPKSPEYGPIPATVFSIPPIASVGLTERQALEQGLDFIINSGDRSASNSMKKVGAKYACYKVLIEDPSGRILGAHLFGPDAAETINIFALAISEGLTAKALKSVLFTFPTFINDVRDMV